MSNQSSPRVPPNHPFLIRTPPPAFCKDFQARAPSLPTPRVNGPTSQSASTLHHQFGRLPAPVVKAPVFGSTDIRERKKIAAAPLLPPVNTGSNPHQLSPLGSADIHSKALFCSSPSPPSQSQNPKFPPTKPREPPSETPSGKSSNQQKGVHSSSQCASTPTIKNTQSLPHFQQSHPSWSPGSDAGTKMKQEEEAIVSEALAFLQEHMKKKAAETDPDTLEEEVKKKHHGKADEREVKSSNLPNIPSLTSERASFSEEKKNSVMDASIQELSTLLVDCPDGPAKGVEGGENNPILVDLTDSADVLGLLKPPSQSETIPKHFPFAMPLDLEVLHSVKEEEMPRVKDVSFIAENPSLRSELMPKHLPRWFSNPTCSDSSDEEGEMVEVEGAEQKRKAGIAENEPHAAFIAQDELLVQGFILSEPHSLAVSRLSL